jgi:hypothetical protein
VAPAKRRRRAEFVRLAIRSAIDRALDARTASAYRDRPLSSELLASDLAGWDAKNELARAPTRALARRKRAKIHWPELTGL